MTCDVPFDPPTPKNFDHPHPDPEALRMTGHAWRVRTLVFRASRWRAVDQMKRALALWQGGCSPGTGSGVSQVSLWCLDPVSWRKRLKS